MTHQERLLHACDYVMSMCDGENPPHRFFEEAAEKFGLDPEEVDDEFDRIHIKPEREYWYALWKQTEKKGEAV